MKNSWCFLVVLILMVLSTPSKAGWYTGNTGDIRAEEFVQTGRDIVRRLKLIRPVPGMYMPDAQELRSAIEETLVHSEFPLFNNGFEVDAVNFAPEKKQIIIHKTRWDFLRLPENTRERFKLVLHEYLWILGKNDTNFLYTNPILDLLDPSTYSPNAFWSPINPVNLLALSIKGSAGCYFEPIQFDVSKVKELVTASSKGKCSTDQFRTVKITKISTTIPIEEEAPQGMRGTFHSYNIELFTKSGLRMLFVTYEPEWGRCLYPDDEACRSTGKLSVGNVAFSFGFLAK